MNVGDFVYDASLRVNGRVEEVFRESWEPNPASGCRTLTKLPPAATGTGRVICAVRLTRPLNLLAGFDQLPSGFVPVVEEGDSDETDLVYAPLDSLKSFSALA